MLNFFIFAVIFVLILSIVVRFSGMAVRNELHPLAAYALTLTFIGVTMWGWWLVTSGATVEQRVLPPIILPNPMEVLHAFPKLHFEQQLTRSIMISFVRVTTGFTLAAVLAVTLGVYMASFQPVSAFFKPLALTSAYVPIICFIPLTLAWWGANETQKIGFLFIACFVALLPLVIKDITDISPSFLDVAMTKGASQWQLVRHVLFPVALPDIWDHMRGVYGVGWGWIILAEVVNGQEGIGYLISVSERRGHTNATFAIIIVIVAIAVVCDKIWKSAGKWMFPYRT